MPTAQYKISDTWNDCHQGGAGGVITGGVNMDCAPATSDASKNNIGLRWVATDLDAGEVLPQGVTIVSATMQIYGRSQFGRHVQCDIYGHGADDASPGFGNNDGPYERTKTTASVSWDTDYSNADGFVTSPDLSTIFQELVDRPGFASAGISLFMIAKTRTSSTFLRARTVDFGTSYAAVLDLEWEVPAGGNIGRLVNNSLLRT